MKILLIKTSALGDIIQSFPVVAYLRARFPDATIDWVVEASHAPLVQAHPDINHVITIDTKSWRRALLSPLTWQKISYAKYILQHEHYDLLVDLQGNAKSGMITFFARAAVKLGFGKQSAPEKINTLFTTHQHNLPSGQNIRQDYLSLVQQYFNDTSSFSIVPPYRNVTGGRVMVCPGSAWKNKQLTPETLQAFLAQIQNAYACHFTFVWGDEKEHALCASLQHHFSHHSTVLDRQPLPALQNIMAQMDLVIAMDSLPLHLAATTGVPTFSIFGPSSARKYAPVGEQHHTYQGSCPYGRTFEKRCPILRTCPTGACMHDLSSDQLFVSFVEQCEQFVSMSKSI